MRENLILVEQILSFMSRPFLKRFCCYGKKQKSQKLSPFENMVGKHGGIPREFECDECFNDQHLHNRSRTVECWKKCYCDSLNL